MLLFLYNTSTIINAKLTLKNKNYVKKSRKFS